MKHELNKWSCIMEKRMPSIEIARYICAILIVFVHGNLFIEKGGWYYIVGTQVLPRIAVPFFFTVSGFFYQNQTLREIIDRYRKVIISYLIWTAIYWSWEYVYGEFNYRLGGMLYRLLTGSYYHLWFIPALLFAIISINAGLKVMKYKTIAYLSTLLYCGGVIFTAYVRIANLESFKNNLFSNPYFNYNLFRRYFCMAIPYFVLGIGLKKASKRIKLSLVISLFFWILEILVIKLCDEGAVVTITLALPFVLIALIQKLIEHPDMQLERIGVVFGTISRFMFYSHLLVMGIIKEIFPYGNSVQYVIHTVVICSLIGGVFGIKSSLKEK